MAPTNLFGTFGGPGTVPGGLTSTTAYYANLGLNPPFLFAVASECPACRRNTRDRRNYTRATSIAVMVLELVIISADSARWGFLPQTGCSIPHVCHAWNTRC